MTVTVSQLPRAFRAQRDAEGTCPLCNVPLRDSATWDPREQSEGELLFYLTGRKATDGGADMLPSRQVAPSVAQTLARGPRCTCRGRYAHTARCGAYVRCSCPTRRSRRGRRYVRHARSCHNRLRYQTLPGYWDHAVHVSCARDAGFVTPVVTKATRGTRAQGNFGVAPEGPASPERRTREPIVDVNVPTASETQSLADSVNAQTGGTVIERAPQWSRDWAAREAQTPGNRRRQAEAREAREAEARAREAAAESEAESARAAQAAAQAAMVEGDASVARFRLLQLEPEERAPEPDPEPEGPDPSAERFRRLILD